MPGLDHLYGNKNKGSSTGTTYGAAGGPPPPGSGTGGTGTTTGTTWPGADMGGGIDTTVPAVDTTPDPVANVSTGMGADDLKVQAQQKAAAEQKQKYIDKLKAFAASMSSSPGLYGSLYGPEAEELFNPYLDPTLDDDPDTPGVQSNLYNLEEGAGFSGDIPITEYQKLKFLSDYGLGSGLGSLMATDSSGNAILDSSGNIIKTGLGSHISDNWAEAFDPGGLRYGDDPLTTGGSAIREYFEDLSKNYFDQNWYGGDWDEYLGEPYSGYPESASMTDPKWWTQRSLGELDPTGFANLEQMYGEELANRMAAPHSWGIEPFSEMIIEGDY
mgnify:CR=1 FL=1